MGVTAADISLPHEWYTDIEKSREKAMKLLKRVAALEMNNEIIVGLVDDVCIDKLYRNSSPFCKITLKKVKKYDTKEKLQKEMEEQIFFVNKPRMIMDMTELSTRFPNIHEDAHVGIRRGDY